jgi:hypothetical protein
MIIEVKCSKAYKKQSINVNLNTDPSHLRMQDCASRKRVSSKALIEDETMDGEGRAKQDARAENGCSIIKINNATDALLSPCPKGAKLENQLRVAYSDVCT